MSKAGKTSYQDVSYAPVNSIENDGPLIFRVPANEQYFTDLSKTFLIARVKVVQGDGVSKVKSIPKSENGPNVANSNTSGPNSEVPQYIPKVPEVTVPNDFFDCQFSKIALDINGVRVGSQHSLHPQVGVIRILVSYSPSTASANLKNTIGWQTDMGDDMREAIAAVRFKLIENSKPVTFVGRLSHDVFNSSTLLPPRNSLTVRFDRTSAEFSLIRSELSKKKYKIVWEEAHLLIRRVKVADSPSRTILTHIGRGSHYYLPYIRTDARAFQIPKGSTQWRANSLFLGTLPERALFVLTDSDSIGSGSYSNNPTIFPAKKYELSYLQFFVDDRAVLPRPYEPDWENKCYQEAFIGLLRTLGFEGNLGNRMGFDYESFSADYGIFGVMFKGVGDDGNSGAISVEVRFKNPLPSTVAGLLIPEYRSSLILDENKSVEQIDY